MVGAYKNYNTSPQKKKTLALKTKSDLPEISFCLKYFLQSFKIEKS